MYKKLRFLTTLLLLAVSVGAWAETEEIFSVSCSNSDAPEGWSVHVEYANGYWQVSAGGNAYIITSSYDLSSYKSVEINAEIANYGSGNGNAKAKYEISYDGGETFTETGTAGSPTSSTYVSANYTLKSVSSRVVIKVTNNLTSGRVMRFKNFKLIGTKKEIGADPYTVTFSDGGSVTETSGGAGVTLPSRNAIGEYTFAGWSETNVETETTTAPIIIPVGTYHPTANITLYPVYTRTEGGSAQNNTASVTIADYASANNWVSGSNSGPQYTEVILNSDVKATTTGTGNNGKYYSDWRFYQSGNGNVIISTTNGTLKSVKFTFSNSNGGTLNYNNSAVTSGTAVNVSGTSAEFTVGNSGTATNGQIRITAIEVIYTIDNSTTYYWSAPVAAAVERPVIDVPETFTFSTIATISCDTEDATIKYSFDNETWSDYSEPLTITETTTIYAKGVKGTEESVVVSKSTTKQQVTPTVTINATGITNTNVYEGTDAGTLAATVAYNDNAIADAIVTWSGNNNEVATIDAETGIVTLVAAGTVTFTATYAGNSDYAQATATYEMTVTNTDPNAPGTENNPYTVAQAIEYINTLGTSTSPNEVYVSGIISQVNSYNSNYKSITYWISDDGTTSTQMQVYSGKGLNGADFSSMDDLQVGDIVTVKGFVKTYSDTPEFDKNNQLVSHRRPTNTDPTITLDPSTINVDAEEHNGTIAISLENLTVEDKAEFGVQYYNGNEPVEEIDWITVEVAEQDPQVGEGFVVSYIVAANEGPARTATFKVYVEGGEDDVWSNPATITQDAAPGIVDNYELFTGDLVEGDYLIVYEGKAMNTTVESNRLQYTEVTAADDVITTDNAAIVWHIAKSGNYWTIYNADANAYVASTGTKNQAKMLADGTDDKALWTVSGTETYEFVNKKNTDNNVNANLRNNGTYGFACYATTTGGALSLYKKVEAAASTATITLNAACTDGEMVYGTYSNTSAFVVSDDIVVAEVGIVDGKLYVEEYETDDVVPANTGVMVSALEGGNYTVTLTDVKGTSVLGTDNNLRPTGAEGINATKMAAEDADCLYYRLTMHNGTQIGFWWGADEGAAFDVAANKAYLAVPAENGSKIQGFTFGNDGDATEIVLNALKGEQNGATYNLQGQKVGSEYKGIVIKNNKKYMVK